ncbi:MAG: hypothetical protein CMM74_09785 [Rhodospirillaceae bacterium]|nr:hypothetical protein [Rhodospirillaceae bacterium]
MDIYPELKVDIDFDDSLVDLCRLLHRRHLSAKIRAHVDFMADRFGPRPYWDEILKTCSFLLQLISDETNILRRN